MLVSVLSKINLGMVEYHHHSLNREEMKSDKAGADPGFHVRGGAIFEI